MKLLAASKDNEAGYIMRALQVSCMCTSQPHAGSRLLAASTMDGTIWA